MPCGKTGCDKCARACCSNANPAARRRSEPVLKRQREFAAQLVLALQRLPKRATTSNASSLEGCSRRGGRRSTDSPCRTWRGTASVKHGGANARSVIGNCTRWHVGAKV